jgi:circadian clock protein KaiB
MSPARANAVAQRCLLKLTLYVAGNNAFSRQARANLDGIIRDAGVQLDVQVEVIDVLETPEVTLVKRIFITPALLMTNADGVESLIVGDFTRHESITQALQSARVA